MTRGSGARDGAPDGEGAKMLLNRNRAIRKRSHGLAGLRRVAGVSLAMGVLGGCAASVPVDGPEQVSIRAPRAGFAANHLVVSTTAPVDTVSNGHGDQFTVVVYLFGPADQYPLPFWADGSFEFWLRDTRTGEEIMRWTFDTGQARSSRQLLQPGPAYLFDMSLIEAGGPGADVFPLKPIELLARFVAADGPVVESRPQDIRLGGTGRPRSTGGRAAGSGGS